MMFSSSKLLAVALMLAGCITASPTLKHKREDDGDEGDVIIGYRTVRQEQADIYEKEGRVVYDGMMDKSQLGDGVYLTQFRGGWKSEWGYLWHCKITANADVIKQISKVWVPERENKDSPRLWFESDDIDRYIESFPYDYDPARTLRMGYVHQFGDLLQLLIPPQLANDPRLNLKAECEPKFETFPEEVVDWDNGDIWKANRHGDKGSPTFK
ncbi:hypothetical protein FQN49_007027 [Arthroderma sp. PD_2]|nr:hypothetical protein FQN49_007027 [Arthroderma sp. PD_2]